MIYRYNVYKADKRTKTGKRLLRTHDLETTSTLQANAIADTLKGGGAFIVEHYPAGRTVTNLMTGERMEIDTDTPWCCNPASETYWSM